ncbi:polysaccharide deacetylase family protein [Luteipulveratus flavus]|uniref:Lipoprotein n=1 Tax=Luteipulveratus flavus TaxID=3031728 RepID=A0ABT6CEA3_9MICO|nr:hypothetical protein [Luteipulveratus sp. YIM 133296]MDF8265616.1 hypothetical protein [Luteipulveratus sp. YIM 133296]
MTQISRRAALAAAAVGTGGALAACAPRERAAGPAASSSKRPSTATTGATPSSTPAVRLIGDGSMSDTGPQPHQPPRPHALRPGERPPQFVVISWDGGGQTGARLNSYFQDVARRYHASMTYFLSAIYFLPRARKDLYHPPRHRVGASDIGYFPDEYVHATIEQTGKAWLAGHEIATHFNGHFCGPTGVSQWSPQDWKSEIDQVHRFVAQWRTNTGFTDLPALPFDYTTELVGGRAPCLEGADNLRLAAAELGWRYDSSATRTATWPTRTAGPWDLSMQPIPLPGTRNGVIAMDYNLMANQSGSPNGDPAMRATWKRQAVEAYAAGFLRAYDGNRAPLVIGNHFERWNGGIYMEAVEAAMAAMAQQPDTRFVSFRQLCDWLDVQSPAVLQRLQVLQGAPAGGWDEYLQLV